MSAPPLTTVARCLDASCGWAAEGEPATVEKAAARHVKAEGHGVSTTSTNPDAPARTAKP